MNMKLFKIRMLSCCALFVSISFMILMAQSCDRNENVEALMTEEKSSNLISEEALVLKKSLIQNQDLLMEISRQQNITKSIDVSVPKLFVDLNEKSLKMLETYGIYYSDLEDMLDGKNDPRITLIGVFWIALLEENSNDVFMPRMKTRSEPGDDGVCYDLQSILNCAGLAIGLTDLSAALQNLKCISKTAALAAFKTAAKRALGVAGVALAIATFGDCMGWYDIPGI